MAWLAFVQAVDEAAPIDIFHRRKVDKVFRLRSFGFGISLRDIVELKLDAFERRIGFLFGKFLVGRVGLVEDFLVLMVNPSASTAPNCL